MAGKAMGPYARLLMTAAGAALRALIRGARGRIPLCACAALLSCAILASGAATPSFADDTADADAAPQTSIGISPTKQKIDIAAGEVYTGSLALFNTSGEPVEVGMGAAPFSIRDGDYSKVDTSAETARTQITRWITFDEEVVTIPPEGRIEVSYTVTVPKDIPDGGQYAAIMAQETAPRGSTVQVVSRVGMLLYAHPDGQTREDVRLLSTDMGGLWRTGGPVTATAELEDAGNVDTEVTATLTVADRLKNGRQAGEPISKSVTLLPETTYGLELMWEDVPYLGIFDLSLDIAGPGLAHTESATVIIAPIWALIVVLVVIALLIVQVLYFRGMSRWRREREAEAAAQGEIATVQKTETQETGAQGAEMQGEGDAS